MPTSLRYPQYVGYLSRVISPMLAGSFFAFGSEDGRQGCPYRIGRYIQADLDVVKLFRRALRREDQEAFDALWRFARRHAAPASMASRPLPIEAIFMSMLVALERQALDNERQKESGGVAL